jgi:TolB-like protein/AraC-like DNA-binding protein
MNLAYTNENDFIRRLTEIVEAHLDNEQFGVEELTKISGISHSTLHRRLKKLGKHSVNQFIRSVRMQKAMLLLQQDEFSVSEVAWKTGFGSPAYFSSSFHEYFGISPSEVKKRNIPEHGSNDNVEGKEIEEIQAFSPKTEQETGSFHRYRRFIWIFTMILPILVLCLIVYMAFFRIAPAKSIMVMPFMDYSGNAQNPYFSDGIREDILNSLDKVSNLRVISRTTSDHFRGKNLSSGEIAKEVKARYVLEGSVRQEGLKVRITVQLIDARSDQHLWSENYDRELTGFLGVQGEIARRVAEKLETVLSDQGIQRINKLPTQNPVAYDHYLRGRFLINKASGDRRADLNKEGLVNSIRYFEMAIRADSSFAQAYAGLADAWLTLSAWSWYRPYEDGLRKAKEYAEKALKIDPDCAEAHFLKAWWLIWPERKFEEGRREFETTLRLSPNFPGAHQNYAQFLMITGPIEEARRHMDRTIELDPYYWVAWNLNAWIYYFEEKYEKAIKACQMARDLKGDYWETDWLFFLYYARLGEGEKATEELQRLFRRYPGTEPYLAEIKNAAKKSGVPGLFRWLIDLNLNRPIKTEGLNGHPYFLSWWYALLGEKEKSLYWLEKNMSEPKKWEAYFDLIATNPDFDLLRNDPRFLSIIDRRGLTPYNRRKAR